MNWPLKAFRFGPTPKSSTDVTGQPPLKHEWAWRRFKKPPEKSTNAVYSQVNDEGKDCCYREYENHVYDEARAKEFWEGDYPIGVACRASRANTLPELQSRFSAPWSEIYREANPTLDEIFEQCIEVRQGASTEQRLRKRGTSPASASPAAAQNGRFGTTC